MTTIVSTSWLDSLSKTGMALSCLWLLGCDGDDITDDKALCDQLNNQTYFAETLGEGGMGPDGLWFDHWSVRFSDGDMLMSQSDFGMSGDYSCVDGNVLLESINVPGRTLSFSEDLKTLYFDPFSESGTPAKTDLTYIQAPKDLTFDDHACKQVMGKTYIEQSFSRVKNSDDPKAAMTQLALEFELTFSDGQKVDVLEYGERYAGYFDCTLDVLHVHRDSADSKPLIVNVGKEGVNLTIEYADRTVHFVEDSDSPVLCTLQYDPVCAAKNTGIQCVTTPCPTEVYETYGNQCSAEAEGSRVLFSGECGDKEGQPVEDGPVACTKEYAPVCGALVSASPCTIMPCPASKWTTFGNNCVAQAAGASYVSEGECGANDDQIVRELPPSVCPAVALPVCAKGLASWDCKGESPCFTHKYSSYGNDCEAKVALAEIAFDGLCGDLGGVLAQSQPLVKMTDTAFPKTNKTPMITSASIDGDVVHLKLGYSGCDEQHFDLYISSAFMESFPVQTQFVFTPQVEDGCDAAFETSFEYDLIPLKINYQKAYQTQTGSISLGDLGLYEF